MNFKRFDTVYVHGCSHTAGGGLYEENVKKNIKKFMVWNGKLKEKLIFLHI